LRQIRAVYTSVRTQHQIGRATRRIDANAVDALVYAIRHCHPSLYLICLPHFTSDPTDPNSSGVIIHKYID
jgi:hypothetical protein